MECNFLAGSVKANNVKNRVTVIKNTACSVCVGDKELILHFEGNLFHTEVSNLIGINANKRSAGGFTVKKAIGVIEIPVPLPVP